MHHMDTKCMEKKLDGKNAVRCIEQVLEATLHKTAAVQPPTTHHKNCWRSKDERITNILPWTPSHGRAEVG